MPFHARHGCALALLAGAIVFTDPAWAQTCQLKQVASIDLVTLNSTRPMLPVTINGVPKLFLLDTGGYTTQVSREVVDELKLPQYQTTLELRDVAGNSSHVYVAPDTIVFGTLKAEHLRLMVSPANIGADGILSADLMFRYDIEMDFGAGKLNYFSQDHCPGKVVYWNPESVAEVPLTVRDRHIYVQVTLDGKPFDALVDTGASRSVISMPVAQGVFGLGPDSPGVTPAGNVNGENSLASYVHTFSSLSFEGIAVQNPTLLLVPDRMAAGAKTLGSRLADNETGVNLPKLTLGMDILRHLRMYMALKEGKFYVSAATPASPTSKESGQSEGLRNLDKAIALSPTSASLLNDRCFSRGIENVKLEGALADCNLSLQLRPDNAATLDSQGLVLFRLGRFQQALENYERVLKLQPAMAAALYMRGQVKKKLGDVPGGNADIAAAKKMNPGALLELQRGGLSAD